MKTKWTPEIGEDYSFINGYLQVITLPFYNDNTDKVIFENCKTFKTAEEAREYLERK